MQGTLIFYDDYDLIQFMHCGCFVRSTLRAFNPPRRDGLMVAPGGTRGLDCIFVLNPIGVTIWLLGGYAKYYCSETLLKMYATRKYGES
jgi:hypothetical protein